LNADYNTQLEALYTRLGSAKIMVLATSKDDVVSARNMSCIISGGVFYVQTDRTLPKYGQIKANPNVALCAENIQVEGIAKDVGSPTDSANSAFSALFERHYKGSYDAYSHLSNEVVIAIRPTRISLWEYENGKAFRIAFDMVKQRYTKEEYIGE
jgi:general stress protein 26